MFLDIIAPLDSTCFRDEVEIVLAQDGVSARRSVVIAVEVEPYEEL